MATSDLIASFILDALESAGGCAELRRSSLADKFNCVPSQINYVISTRFSPEHGYIVESRRGEGGYIRIKRVCPESRLLIMHAVNAIGDELDEQTAGAFVSNIYNAGALDIKSARLILSAMGNNALRPVKADKRDAVRASIFKQMLISTISD
jgi:transcriptional regulator CtsR